MVEQREVVRAADVQTVLGTERYAPRATAARGTRHQDQEVPHQATNWVSWAAGDRGRDEAVRRALEQRHLPACGCAKGIGVAVAPVLIDQGASAKIADP